MMKHLNLCIDCFEVFETFNKSAKKCFVCRGQSAKAKAACVDSLCYKIRFCDRCDRKFKTLKKRPKVCNDCRGKPYPNIFS